MLAVFAVAAASAQRQVNEADGYRLLVAPDRADGSYGRGDEVRFLVSFEKDGAPVADGELTWEVTKDSWKPKTSGVARVSDGRAVIGGHKLDEPGFLQCRVKFVTPQGHELHAMAGAGVDKLLIGPSMPEPKDFMSYWKRELKKQAKIPMNIRLTPAPSTDPGIAVFDVQADCEPGSFSAYLAYPKDAKPGTLPAMVTLNGAGVKSSRAWWAVSWAKEGLCVLDFNVHGLPNGESDSYYADLENGPMFEYFLFGRDDRDSMFFHEMVMRLIRAIDVITAQPQWDGKTVMVHGCSQGGAQAVMAGCLDPRVDLVCAEIPAMCDHTGLAADRASGWPLLVECRRGGRARRPSAESRALLRRGQLRAPCDRAYLCDGGDHRFALPTDHRICDVQSAQGREAYARASYYGAYPDLAGRGFLAAGRPRVRPARARYRAIASGSYDSVSLNGRFLSREAAVALVAGASAVGLGRIFGAAGSGPVCPVQRMARIYVYGFVPVC